MSLDKYLMLAKNLFFATVFLINQPLYAQNNEQFDPLKYVDPFIGTGGHGHVFLGANVPFGGVQLGPNNIVKGWDWCSGYHYSSKEILGFSHTHLSGTGIGDWGDFLFLPATGPVKLNASTKEDLSDGYGSHFSHSNEICTPGYYKVKLLDYGVTAELTATTRTGVHRYNFPDLPNPHVLIDLAFGIGWDQSVSSGINIISQNTVTGHRFSTGWAKDQKLFFAAHFSKNFRLSELYEDKMQVSGQQTKGSRSKAVLYFDGMAGNEVIVKVGISAVSEEQALLNLKTEAGEKSFDELSKMASQTWIDALGVVKISASEKVMKNFYTALYHSFFLPSVYGDVNGQYRGSDQNIYATDGEPVTTVYSLWDTYRAFHPLMTILRPKMASSMVNSILDIYQKQGKLPVWHLSGNETNTMVGYHAVPVIVDAFLKDVGGFNVNLAYEAIKHSAMSRENGIGYASDLTYIPADSVNESVAKALEYAIDDACISLMADKLGKTEDAAYFAKRAGLYALYFDKKTGFMRGKMGDGQWRTPFDPLMASHRANDYCEGNAWQYTWLVPHDVPGLIKLFGSESNFIEKLDQHFVVSGSMGAEASPDISGMIGQYAHGNEPNHHTAYLYNFVGQPWKTAKRVQTICDTFYTNEPDGLCGNEDAGQMSAWYIYSALGFYPVHPANGVYVIGSPLIKEAEIRWPGQRPFTISVKKRNSQDIYVSKININGRQTNQSFLKHSDIKSGGYIIIEMSSRPSADFGIKPEDRP